MNNKGLLAKVKDTVHADSYSIKNGIVLLRQGFFYRHGGSEDNLVSAVMKAFPTATIHDKGEHWAAFSGGASLARSSHWYVKFSVA